MDVTEMEQCCNHALLRAAAYPIHSRDVGETWMVSCFPIFELHVFQRALFEPLFLAGLLMVAAAAEGPDVAAANCSTTLICR